MRITNSNRPGKIVVLATALTLIVACGDDTTHRAITPVNQPIEASSVSTDVVAPDGTVVSGDPKATQVQPPSDLAAPPPLDEAMVAADLQFWRTLSMRADWIFSTPSFSEMLQYADFVALAKVVKATAVEPLELEDIAAQLTYIDLHLEIVKGTMPKDVGDLVLRLEAPGSLTLDSATAYKDWFETFAVRLPANYAFFVLKQKPDAAPNVYQILNEWSIWVQDASGISTAFAAEDLSQATTKYQQVAKSVRTVDELFELVQNGELLSSVEA